MKFLRFEVTFFIFTIVMLIIALIFSPSYSFTNEYGDFKNVKYIKNYDGDTLTVDIENVHPLIGSNIPVRILGIDTAEIRSSCEKEKNKALVAKALLEHLCRNAKKIDLINVQRDKYFRILAEVYIDDIDVSKILIESGVAVEYYGDEKFNWCE